MTKKKKKRAKRPPQPRRRPPASTIERAVADKDGRGNPRAGCRDAAYRQRRNFRHYDDASVRVVWDWAVLKDADGFQLFTQREIAAYLNMSYSAVGNIVRCMPDGWGEKRRRR